MPSKANYILEKERIEESRQSKANSGESFFFGKKNSRRLRARLEQKKRELGRGDERGEEL